MMSCHPVNLELIIALAALALAVCQIIYFQLWRRIK